jgi:hypothetical protein
LGSGITTAFEDIGRMKAAVYRSYGPAGLLKLEDVPVPAIQCAADAKSRSLLKFDRKGE